jgi:MYXO-CTERM domain-containing protein
LSVTAVSIIDMNETASVLTFANTGTWTGLLKVWNYSGGAVWTGSTGDKLLFDAGSAPASNLVQFYSDGGITPVGVGGGFITSGLGSELVPVPEASTVFGALALLGLVGYRERRRR